MPKVVPYSGAFKKKVVEDVIENKIGYREAMRKYGIAGKMTIQKWERIYLAEGAEGLYVDHRGRKSTSRVAKLPKQIEQDLLAEVQYLRAENDYLKKLNALVSERVQREKKHK